MTQTRAKQPTTTAKGLGWPHQQAVAGLRRKHVDGAPCGWCGRPMYLDRTRNWDYQPDSTNTASGSLHGDHKDISRAEALRRGLLVPRPNRLLHGRCNIQRGEGGNDHLAASRRPVTMDASTLAMPWPW